MATQVDIVNTALSIIGSRLIESLDEGSRESDVATVLFPIARDDFLAEYNWSFATKRRDLSLYSDDNDGEYGYAFYLPDDYIRLIDINFDRNAEYKIEGAFLYCNYDSVTLRYVYRLEDYTKYTAKAVIALANRVAMLLVYPLYGDEKDESVFERKYLMALERAKEVDGGTGINFDNSPDDWGTGDWQNM